MRQVEEKLNARPGRISTLAQPARPNRTIKAVYTIEVMPEHLGKQHSFAGEQVTARIRRWTPGQAEERPAEDNEGVAEWMQ